MRPFGRELSGRRAGVTLMATAIAASAFGVTGCASGQNAQTAEVLSGVDGVHVTVGAMQLADVTLAYPSGGQYRRGSDARVQFTVVNNGTSPDTLTSVAVPGQAQPAKVNLTVRPGASIGAYGDGPSVVLSDVQFTLRSSQQANVTFDFISAGAVTVPVPVAAPESYLSTAPSGS